VGPVVTSTPSLRCHIVARALFLSLSLSTCLSLFTPHVPCNQVPPPPKYTHTHHHHHHHHHRLIMSDGRASVLGHPSIRVPSSHTRLASSVVLSVVPC
jgi:hypothetical protein